MDEPLVVGLPGWRDPLDVIGLFAASRMPALLYSGAASRARRDVSRWSLLAADPFDVVFWRSGQTADPFRLIEQATARHRCAPAGGLPFAGGAVGYVGYGTAGASEAVRPAASIGPARPDGMPDLQFGIYAWAIVWDHVERRWCIVSSGAPERGPARRALARRQAREVTSTLQTARTRAPAPRQLRATLPKVIDTSVPHDRYLAMVAQAKELIADGEFYQVNLSQRIELSAPADPVAMFRGIARKSPAPFSAYLDAGSFCVASASPERFVSLRGRAAESRPIKGTRPRGRTPARDRAEKRGLAASPKDRAENVMIVDLVRNDLGRVCVPGTVKVAELFRLESYASVHHLVSIVTGELGPGRDRADLLRALFPAGSMTGAPKARAMQAIEDLEPVRRGIYAGGLGYLSFCGAMDLGIVIRTVVVSSGRAWLSVGGGVVADSEPEAEWRESLDKAASVLEGMGATWGTAGPSPRTARRRRARRT